MTKKEYDDQRAQMMDETQSLIDQEKIDEANALMEKVKALDDQWEKVCDAQANARALSDDPWSGIAPEYADALARMHTGEAIDLTTGKSWVTNGRGVHRDPLYLSDTHGMVDHVRDKGGDMSLLTRSNALADTVRGMVTGKWSDPALKDAVTTSTTGTLIPQVLSSQVIDLARDLSLFTTAGVPVVPMDSNNLLISRIAENPQFSFKAEGEEGDEASLSLDAVKLEAKTVYGYSYVTLEAIESSQNLNAILMQAFAEGIADAIDAGMLYGQDGAEYAPSGIMNDPDVLTLEASNAGYDDIIKAVSAVRQHNYEPTVWAVNAYTDQAFGLLRDSEGRYLDAPGTVTALQKIVSNELAYSAADGSDGLVFLPEAMVIGIQSDVKIKMIEDEACLKRGLVGFQIYAMEDCKILRPTAICKITGLK